jgi:signal transduction histidine kinase
LLRSHRGQRELLATHLASQDQRARELEAFAARVAHDLKGPLSPILIASEVLSTHKDPEVLCMSQRIRRGTTRMTQLIDELLSLSVSGHPSRGKTEVAPVVTELLEELQPALGDAKVDVAVADCTAACPSEVLSLVLRNLVGNASKYRSPERRLELHIDAACENGHVKIAIGDNGMGMDDETREHAFDPFFRAKAARGVEGHGLGLAIVKRTVEALGGSCLLDTALGQGTTVTLELPKVAQA